MTNLRTVGSQRLSQTRTGGAGRGILSAFEGAAPWYPDGREAMNDALLLVDVLNDFRHDDGTRLGESFRDAHPRLRDVLSSSREADLPIVYANDHFGDWTA